MFIRFWRENPQKPAPISCGNLPYLWSHHSLSKIFSWGIFDSCSHVIMCDGSVVLMQAMRLSFGKKNLLDTLNHYYMIATGKAKLDDFEILILHRWFSHIIHIPQCTKALQFGDAHHWSVYNSRHSRQPGWHGPKHCSCFFSPNAHIGINVQNHFSKLQSKPLGVDVKSYETSTSCLDAEDMKSNPRLF